MNCSKCGEPLADAVGRHSVRTLDGKSIVFRRTTDYLICRNCLALYSINRIRSSSLELDPEIDMEAITIPEFVG